MLQTNKFCRYWQRWLGQLEGFGIGSILSNDASTDHRAFADNEGSSYVCRSNEQYGDSNWRDTLPDGGPDHLPAVGGYAFLLI
ncbi:hypothetical protein [Pseudomonas sp. R5-89-07]|uniref:hypothetical protein n=1 Tax=Pseudomonas sp. R5-89-07 TaxID=658644 RepID=UPI0013DE07A5|nr:hypothetical protein [Pseudomonas sp. R5-89-07]